MSGRCAPAGQRPLPASRRIVGASRQTPGVTPQLPGRCQRLLKRQRGIIASWQAESAGLQPRRIEMLLRSGRWQRVDYGVYAAFTGGLRTDAFLWAAVLRAGPQAVLSHETAGALYGILDHLSEKVHVTVPHERRLRPATGLVIHRSTRFLQVADLGLLPPRTQVEETVFDLTDAAVDFDSVVTCTFSLR